MTEQAAPPSTRITLVTEEDATGRLAELYEQIKTATGLPFVPDMFRLASLNPNLVNIVFTGYSGIFLEEGALTRQTKELIASWTSRVNECMYCVGTHNFFLQHFGGSEELANAIASATKASELPVDDKTKLLLELVTQVSLAAYKVTDSDWDGVRAAGWSDAQLLEAVFCSALFNFIVRLVDGLGLGTSVARSRISEQPLAESKS